MGAVDKVTRGSAGREHRSKVVPHGDDSPCSGDSAVSLPTTDGLLGIEEVFFDG